MDLVRDIVPLSKFQRRTSEYLAQMKKTGQPLVLTVNGSAELVVQDAASYQRLADVAEHVEMIEALREGLDDVDAGRTAPLAAVFARLDREHGASY